jgi:hypothetical protein
MGIIYNTMLFIFEIEIVSFSSISRDYISLQAPYQIFVNPSSSPNNRFLVPLHLMFRFTLYIWCAILYCCYWYSYVSAFLTVSWVMTSPSVWLPSTHLIIQNFGKVEMSISRFLRRKLCFMGIIRNTMLFIFQMEMFSLFSISRDYISLQAPCEIFVDRAAWLESPVSHSVNSDVQIHAISLMFHTVLLLSILISLRNILIPLTYGNSGFAIELL